MGDSREYPNPYAEYVLGAEYCTDLALTQVSEKLRMTAQRLLTQLDTNFWQIDETIGTVYSGAAGVAFLYYFLGRRGIPGFSVKALSLMERVIPALTSDRVSFLGGDVGPLALAAVLYYEQGQRDYALKVVSRIMGFLPKVLSQKQPGIDEVLYGRSGFLYSLLYLNKNIGPGTVSADILRQVVSVLLEAGCRGAELDGLRVPLMYRWHDKRYLGAAHGLAGTLYMILLAKEYVSPMELRNLVHPTINYLQSYQFGTGNFPSSMENRKDKLTQWCHGAPGMVELFCLAHEVFEDDTYLATALKCGEAIWRRGLLKKGYSLCHGVAGNAYAFLRLYQTTREPKHLYRAYMFAEWCSHYNQNEELHPDHPLSLYEGLAGVIYFLFDMQDPLKARFPAFGL